jgi:hypothetical protein
MEINQYFGKTLATQIFVKKNTFSHTHGPQVLCFKYSCSSLSGTKIAVQNSSNKYTQQQYQQQE